MTHFDPAAFLASRTSLGTGWIGQADAGGGRSILEFVQGGGTIGYVIIALSVLAVAAAIKQIVEIRPASLAPPEDIASLRDLLSRGDADGAIEYCGGEQGGSFLCRIVGAGFARCKRSPFGWLELKGSLEEAGQAEVARFHRGADLLGLVIAIAPMLGLLGTVVGMVGAFDTISSTEGFPRADQLAGDISVALITTVLGLVVAIPCMAVYTFIRGRIDRAATHVAGVVEQLAETFEDAVGGGQPAAKPQASAPGGAARPAAGGAAP